MLQLVKIFIIREIGEAEERKESAGGVFLHVFKSVKGSCVYAFFVAWEDFKMK